MNDLYVLVCERDTADTKIKARPIVWEQFLDQGAATLEAVKSKKLKLGDHFGKVRIARLEFVEGEE